MTKLKKEPSPVEKTRCEEMLDAILGPDEEMDDALADEILQTYEITEAELVEEFKTRLQADARRFFQETGKPSDNLTNALHSIRDYQQKAAPQMPEPKTLIGSLLNGILPPQTHSQTALSFRNRKDGELSDNDKKILDDKKAEVEGED